MSNRKYPRLSDGYHDRSPYHPYQTKKQGNCIADRDRSPSGSNSKESSPYFSSRHSNTSPRSQRSRYSYIRSKDNTKKGSSQSPNNSHHDSNSHTNDRRTKINHVSGTEEFPWSQHVSSSGKVYYYNFKTEKSQWEKPKEWIERERREKESKDRNRTSSKDTILRKDDPAYDKSRTYVSKHSFKDAISNDKPDSTRILLDDRGRENHKHTESDRGPVAIKTISAYTSAQSTLSHRSAPLAAVNSDVSPAESLQDVSPPSTPSSRASIFDTGSHSSSPQLVTVSPLGTPYQNSQSPLGLSRHGILHQVSSSSTLNSHQYSKPLHSIAQPHYNSGHYGLVNNGNTPNVLASSQLKTSYDGDANSRTALHPLQQATLLHQRKLSESRNHAISSYQQVFQTGSQPVTQIALIKDSTRINQSPGSPIIMTPTSAASTINAKEQFQSISHIQTSAPNSAQVSPSSVSPLPVQSSPAVNLQALAKYADKSLINHVINWPTEALDKQVQRLNDEGTSSSGEASKTQIQQFHLISQLDLLDITLNIGSKRISSMKEATKTLEKLLAESDKKSLT